jgi:two-component system response regulator HydG
VLAATHVDLERRIAVGTFREDLFFRLGVVTIDLPPLAERLDDIIELIHSFASNLARPLRFTVEAIEWLQHKRSWPGNVRELENAIERLALLSDSEEVDVTVLRDLVGETQNRSAAEIEKIAREILALPDLLGSSKLDLVERAVLHHAIETCHGNKSAAARMVGVHRKSLDRKWERLTNEPPESSDPPDD